jgi:hypothetical protein
VASGEWNAFLDQMADNVCNAQLMGCRSASEMVLPARMECRWTLALGANGSTNRRVAEKFIDSDLCAG